MQPPSGGCVLKLHRLECWAYCPRSHLRVAVCWNPILSDNIGKIPRSHLRVAVCWNINDWWWARKKTTQPPPGGCVLKPERKWQVYLELSQPPPGGCVLKQNVLFEFHYLSQCSHLRVAVCWNSLWLVKLAIGLLQPPSGGCVLKPNISS